MHCFYNISVHSITAHSTHKHTQQLPQHTVHNIVSPHIEEGHHYCYCGIGCRTDNTFAFELSFRKTTIGVGTRAKRWMERVGHVHTPVTFEDWFIKINDKCRDGPRASTSTTGNNHSIRTVSCSQSISDFLLLLYIHTYIYIINVYHYSCGEMVLFYIRTYQYWVQNN